ALSHTAYVVREGIFKKITDGGRGTSLGLFYTAVTEGVGLAPYTEEEELSELAAQGASDVAYKDVQTLVSLRKDKMSFRTKKYKEIVSMVHQLLHKGISREDIAASAQRVLEETVIAHVNELLLQTKTDHVVFAGGIFKNARLTQQ